MSMAFLYPWKKHPTAAAKAISSTSFSSENRYEGVSLSKKNSGEAFSGSSSIPVVDLDEKVAALDRRSSKPDDPDVSGGFRNADVAVPYDQHLVNGGAEKTGMRVQPGYLSSSEKTKMSYKSSPLNVPHHQPNLNSNNKNSPPFFDDELDENSEAGVSAAALKKAIEHAQKIINIAKILMERKKKERLQDGFSIVNKETMDENLGEILDNLMQEEIMKTEKSAVSWDFEETNSPIIKRAEKNEENRDKFGTNIEQTSAHEYQKCGEKTTKGVSNNEIDKSQKLEKNDQQQRIERAIEKDLDDTESAQRRKARLERHKRITERVANALAEKKSRDLLVHKEQTERNRLSKNLDADIKRWATGKEGNLRALLSTLQYILGPESGWKAISLTEIITSAAVKKAYRKATLCLHPDKLQQRRANIRQKYICEKVFDLLRVAWNKFNSEEM